MNKKITVITTIVGLLFISFVIIFVNKTIAKNEDESMAAMPGMSDNGDMKNMPGMTDNEDMKNGKVHNIDQSELLKYLNNADVTIVDLREPNLYDKSHIPNSINIPFAEFQSRFQELDPNKNIILVCHVGEMGETGGQFLLQQGYQHVSNLTGGMAQWSGSVES